ncbi:hypothetical protein WMF45_36615 [Sorangium sp. So ce448]|uniref:hypothetical protein n=1 Tax=Sorangium sp. So ce448 TaxID=3133314 RepID=UPI003F5DBC0E
MRRELLGSVLCGLLLAACSDDENVSPIGAGGAGGAGGMGGAGGSTSSSAGGGTTGDGGGGSGGAAPVACGGSAGATCGETEYCATPDLACAAEAQGECTPRPRVGECPDECQGVCGCDQRTYCNECMAHAAGVNASRDTVCASADYVIADHDRVYVHHADLREDRCLAISIAAFADSDPLYAGVELEDLWGVLDVALTDQMDDCTGPGMPRDDERTYAVAGATGTMSWEAEPNTGIPCIIDMDITVTLDGEPGTLRFQETSVVVDNTCL